MRKSMLAMLLCSVMFAPAAMAADNGRSPFLKGIDTIRLRSLIEQGEPTDCRADDKQWDTNIQFVANQYAKLKFISEDEHMRQVDENSAEFNSLMKSTKDKDEIRAAQRKFSRYNFMPSLTITVLVLETAGVCAGHVRAELTAAARNSNLVATDVPVAFPSVQLWSQSYLLVGPPQNFRQRLTEKAEQFIKALVDDWAASQ